MRWRPDDTHPGYEFEVEAVQHDDDMAADVGHPDGYVATRGWYKGREIGDADAVLQAIHAEHRMKNIAMAMILENMPEWAKKVVLDSDGDPQIDFFTGRPAMVVKDKFQPTWEWGEADGVVVMRWPVHVVDEPAADEGRKAAEAAIRARYGDRVVVL